MQVVSAADHAVWIAATREKIKEIFFFYRETFQSRAVLQVPVGELRGFFGDPERGGGGRPHERNIFYGNSSS